MPTREPASIPSPLPTGQLVGQAFGDGRVRVRRVAALLAGVLLVVSIPTLPLLIRHAGASAAAPVTAPTAVASGPAAGAPATSPAPSASPARSSSPAAPRRYDFPAVSFSLPETWHVDDYGVQIWASGPAGSGERLEISSYDLTTRDDLDFLRERHYRRCTYVGAPTDIVIDAHRTDVVDCSFVGKHERRIASRIGYRITEILYWGPTPPDESTGLQLVQKSMVVHSGVVSRPALSGKAATGTVMKSAGFSLAAPAGWTQIAQPTSLNARAAGLTPAPLGDAVLGFFTSDAGDGLMVTHHEDPSGLSPFFSTVDHIEAARAADHLSGTVTGVNVNGRLSYVFEDQDPQGRPGFVLISPLGEGYLTVSTRSSTKDKAWDQLVAVVSSLS